MHMIMILIKLILIIILPIMIIERKFYQMKTNLANVVNFVKHYVFYPVTLTSNAEQEPFCQKYRTL